jgi:hypothetical protein
MRDDEGHGYRESPYIEERAERMAWDDERREKVIATLKAANKKLANALAISEAIKAASKRVLGETE